MCDLLMCDKCCTLNSYFAFVKGYKILIDMDLPTNVAPMEIKIPGMENQLAPEQYVSNVSGGPRSASVSRAHPSATSRAKDTYSYSDDSCSSSTTILPKRKVYQLKRLPAGKCGGCNEGCGGAYDRDIGCMGYCNKNGRCDRERYVATSKLNKDHYPDESFESWETYVAGGRNCTTMKSRKEKKVRGACAFTEPKTNNTEPLKDFSVSSSSYRTISKSRSQSNYGGRSQLQHPSYAGSRATVSQSRAVSSVRRA